ncbi:MAG: hypothetical protein ACYTFY_07295 [Planctomycetota bacterium]
MTVPHIPRKSYCAAKSQKHEIERLKKMSIEERIKHSLSISNLFSWLKPTMCKDVDK